MDFHTRVETVEAHQWAPGDPITSGRTLGWLIASGIEVTHGAGPDAALTLQVEGGPITAASGDWIIHHPEHGYSIVDQTSFEATYQPKARTATPRRSRGSVTNVISGTVGGTVIQTGDYQGTLRL